MKDSAEREVVVFANARRLPEAERAPYLDKACEGDAALRRRVEELLRAGEAAEGFLEEPAPGAQRPEAAVAAALDINVAAPGESVGDRIGRYKLLQKIGEGGCGAVYMAEQEEPVRRRVALKVIKLGMDTKQVIARFEAERQALAMMDHANLAKVLDAGTTETGRPYFVMDLVRGIKITDYCDEHKLTMNERLELFMQICHAVQHAHQKGIIHRDLKPSNILVASDDGVPVPKVIDFGIAKATQGRLTDQTLFTAFEQFIGTPAYMSPEQAGLTMQDVDTRSDIYSLGVLLYELLTGRTPFDGKELLASGLDAMRQTIREQEPKRPSTRLSTMLADELTATARHRHAEAGKLIHSLRGELDWIVMKCLEKERARRYETANGLAIDLARHLNCEPVLARPPSKLYEFQKTVQRHKFGFAAAAALITVLAVGGLTSMVEAIRATHAEREQTLLKETAERARANEARQRQQAEADKRKAETEAIKSAQLFDLVRKAFQGVGPSVAMGRDTTMLREILDGAAERIGKNLTNQPEVELEMRVFLANTYHELAVWPRMEESARRSLQLARSSLGETNVYVEDALYKLGDSLLHLGKLDEAEKVTREALQHPLLSEDSSRAEEKANALGLLAQILTARGTFAEAEALERQALALARNSLRKEVVASCLNNLGNTLVDEGNLVEAECLHREALAIRKETFGGEHVDIATSLNNLANVLRMQGRLPEAEAMFQHTLAMRRKLLGTEHQAVATCLHNLATTLTEQSKLAEAEPLFREAIAMRVKQLGKDNPSLPAPLKHLAHLLRLEGKLPEAEILLQEALRIQKNVVGNEHQRVANLLEDLAEVLCERQALTEALSLATEASAMCQRHPDWLAQEQQHAFDVLGDVLTALAGVNDTEKVPDNGR